MVTKKAGKPLSPNIESLGKIVEDKAFWAAHVSSYQQSGMNNKTAYAKANNLNEARWSYWSRKLSGDQPRSKGFASVKVQSGMGQSPALLTVESARGLRLTIHHPEVLKQLPKLMRDIF